MIFIAILTGISIVLEMSYSNFLVTSENHKVAEMYVGTLKYSMTIDGKTTNTLSVPSGETIVDVTITNENPIDTYYKLIYQNNSNVTIKYYQAYDLDNSNNISKTYNKANDKIISNNTNTIKLKITNSSTSSQNIIFKIIGGFATNKLDDVVVSANYTIIDTVDNTTTNTYFCKINDSLTQGLKYVNGQYTYAYKQEGAYASLGSEWKNITTDGWGVRLTDKTSTDSVISKLCTYINNKPVTSMSDMFYSSKTTAIDLSSFNTSNVTNMYGMFCGSTAATLDLSNFDTSNVTDMSKMFMNSSATTIDLSSFDTSKVTNMQCMFWNSQATTLDLSNFDTSNVIDMHAMFYQSEATVLNVSKFDTSKVTDMSTMFRGSQATTLDISNFDTSKVTNMSSMFMGSSATTLDLSNFDTSKVTNMSGMLSWSKATTLDISNFDTSKVTNMNAMFRQSSATALDLSSFDTSNVTNMSFMFYGTKATILDVSNFDTSKVTNMNAMFRQSSATALDLSSFDTSNVTNMSFMFYGTKATILDVSNFDTSKVTNMSDMFDASYSLKTIYVSSKFVTTAVTNSKDMFTSCTKLVGGAGTKYNSSYVDKTYARIDGGTSNPGYFTDIADKPSTFPTDSWETIAASVKAGNSRGYKVGETKEIDMGTYGTHTLRIANTSTPSECSTSGFSQSACGFVIEFDDIITTHVMNDNGTNVGGWPASSMYTFVNNDIYNALPTDLKNAIIDTKVVSSKSREDSSNFISTDKLYLLAPGEIYSDWKTSRGASYDTAKDLTRTLDYYTAQGVTTSNHSGAIKKYGTNASYCWLRSVRYDPSYLLGFYQVESDGTWTNNEARYSSGVSPAFRIG